MGGIGSGRWMRCNAKRVTESQHGIDIRRLNKDGGTLAWTNRGKQTGSVSYRVESDRIVLIYRHRPHGGELVSIEQTVMLDRTPCNYGNYRNWFRCPHCMKRVALLYGAGKYFLCRHCHDLNYASQHERSSDRHMRKARKIRHRVGGGDNLLDAFPCKPKRMHWSTYGRLRHEATKTEQISWALIEKRLSNGQI